MRANKLEIYTLPTKPEDAIPKRYLGSLSNLKTNNKSSLVDAINELYDKANMFEQQVNVANMKVISQTFTNVPPGAEVVLQYPEGVSDPSLSAQVEVDVLVTEDVLYMLSLNGQNQMASFPTNLINNLRNWSIDFYVQTTENRYNSTWYYRNFLISHYSVSSNYTHFGVYTNNGIVGLMARNGSSVSTTDGVTKINDNKLHHIAVTCDGNSIILYVDGKQERILAVSSSTSGIQGDFRIYLGCLYYNGSIQGYHQGNFSMLRIWNKTLSQQEVQSIMTKRFLYTNNNLVSLYPLSEGVGTILYDIVNKQFGTTSGSWIMVTNNLISTSTINTITFTDLSTIEIVSGSSENIKIVDNKLVIG